jgi:hypothetical protein
MICLSIVPNALLDLDTRNVPNLDLSYYTYSVEILPSARRHEVPDDDIVHAYEHVVAWVEVGNDPHRYLLAGPNRAGNLLELVVLDTDAGEFVIHAMVLRASTRDELFGDENP